MRVSEALSQLDVIHDHLSRAETYRGFRAGSVALTGALGLLAAALQPWFVAPDEATRFVWYWVAVAAICALPAGGTALFLRLFCERGLARRRSDRVAFQFLPCVAAGALVTLAFVRAGTDLVVFLPGLWAILFSLGHLAMRPYLPSAVAAVGLFYLAAGAWLLGEANAELVRNGWMVGGVFGVGHLATALALHLSGEERNDG
jgi:hypothetical protein